MHAWGCFKQEGFSCSSASSVIATVKNCELLQTEVVAKVMYNLLHSFLLLSTH